MNIHDLEFNLINSFYIFIICAFVFLLFSYREKAFICIGITLIGGILSTLSLWNLCTALGYVPDDWSANRLSWSAGLIKGYKLYLGNLGPSNGYYYPPIGAWFYTLPAALALY